ncbi:uncharacterized membrane protein YFL067W-like [Arachis ipaensis]|uniref:uncharacterized membrane protein YFL067W-like n=1 Tax=Arachis ipaensis TaxID=130454 RepID=UPI000A2AFCF5|nr:uncharacterized membrane protein YFL067W-like [Arachis ipaensis]
MVNVDVVVDAVTKVRIRVSNEDGGWQRLQRKKKNEGYESLKFGEEGKVQGLAEDLVVVGINLDEVALDLGAELRVGLGLGADLGVRLRLDLDLGVDLVVFDVDLGLGTGLDVDLGLGAGLGVGLGVSLSAGLGLGVCLGISLGTALGLCVGLSVDFGYGISFNAGWKQIQVGDWMLCWKGLQLCC